MRRFMAVACSFVVWGCAADKATATRFQPDASHAALPQGLDAPVGRLIPLTLPPGARSGEGKALNDEGFIVGFAQDDFLRTCERLVMWDPQGRVRDLGACGVPTDINNRNQVVGYLRAVPFAAQTAFRWSPKGGFLDLGPGRANGINAGGVVAGQALIDPNTRHAFLHTDTGGMVDLTLLSGLDADEAYSVNRHGDVLMGGSDIWVWNRSNGVRALTHRDPWSLSIPAAYKINDQGWVSGQSEICQTCDRHAAIWLPDGSPPIILVSGQPSMGFSNAWSISETGRAVGHRIHASIPFRPFTWSMSTGRQDLTRQPFFSCSAFDINAKGTVAVAACDGTPVKWLLP